MNGLRQQAGVRVGEKPEGLIGSCRNLNQLIGHTIRSALLFRPCHEPAGFGLKTIFGMRLKEPQVCAHYFWTWYGTEVFLGHQYAGACQKYHT
jgi:hypothetical protein